MRTYSKYNYNWAAHVLLYDHVFDPDELDFFFRTLEEQYPNANEIEFAVDRRMKDFHDQYHDELEGDDYDFNSHCHHVFDELHDRGIKEEHIEHVRKFVEAEYELRA